MGVLQIPPNQGAKQRGQVELLNFQLKYVSDSTRRVQMLVFKFEIFYQASMLQIGDCTNLYMMVLLFIESLLHLSSIEVAFLEQVVFSKHPMHIQYI